MVHGIPKNERPCWTIQNLPVAVQLPAKTAAFGFSPFFFAILGAVAVVVGIGRWFSGDAAYRSCQAVNSFAGDVAPAQPCTHTTTHIGMIVLFTGIGAVVLAGLIKWADLIAD
jgi:hypothetical protein